MKRAMCVVGLLVFVLTTAFGAKVGEAAPDFTGTDSNGQSHKLSAYRGKYVILEWHNQGCPYTRKHYDTGNMQKLQKDAVAKGVVWLSVISSAPGKQGYVTASEENDYLKRTNSTPTAVLLDPSGEIGRLYGAKTTPHMYIIDPQGRLIYNGAIDDRPTADARDVPEAKNYVTAALDEALAGKPVSTPSTTPYGCTVKYGQ
jgi:thioredoxin-related protein